VKKKIDKFGVMRCA